MTKDELLKMLAPSMLAVALAFFMWNVRAKIFGTDHPDTHWIEMYSGTDQYEAVALGDSRIATGINPEEFKDTKLLNFSFTNACYNQDYLEAAEKRLQSSGEKRFFLLGLGPYNLSKKGCRLSGFEKQKNQNTEMNPLLKASQSFSFFMRPFREGHFASIRDQAPKNQMVYHDNGWLAARNMEEGYEAMNFLALLKDNEASPEIIESLINWTQKQTTKGVSVFFLYPPTGAYQVQAEVTLKNFIESNITEKMKAAGAQQIQMPLNFLKDGQYDGVHLREENAIVWSQFVNTQIKSYFASKDTSGSNSK